VLGKLSSVEVVVAPTVSDIGTMNESFSSADVLVDAMLGTGARGPLGDPLKEAVALSNLSKAWRVAIDVPTGLDSANGSVAGDAFRADLTVTHHRPKVGLLAAAASEFVGKLQVISLGIPPDVELFAGPGDLRLALKPKGTYSHKGQNGRLLVVGGSSRYVGAPALAALAALAVGIDISVVAVPSSIAPSVRVFSPDLIVTPLPSADRLGMGSVAAVEREAESADVVVMGMGLGLDAETKLAVRELVDRLISIGKPMVIDADALKALGEHRRGLKLRGNVVTPHSGEFLALTGTGLPDEEEVGWQGRLETVRGWAQRMDTTFLLKSRYDIITDGSKFKIKTIGNPGMTGGGTGDVLAGVVGAIMSRGESPFRSAVAASFLNSYAGDMLAESVGQRFTARDLLEQIPAALKRLGI
jgi:NAD(P)H-hydrate epimerase